MPKRVLKGVVVSNKGDKTATVLVERRYRHPLYKKFVKSSRKFRVHDVHNCCVVGEEVWIKEHRPISKSKRWLLLEDATQDTPSPAPEEGRKLEPKTA